MDYFALVFIFFSFFVLYSLSKNDFLLLRRNISLPIVFDTVLLASMVAFLIGRLMYIIDIQVWDWLHPIRFLHIFRLPGFSYYGAFLGFLAGTSIFLLDKKALKRVLDIVTLSYFPLFLFMALNNFFPLPFFTGNIIVICIFIVLFFFLLRAHKNYTLRDGSIMAIALIVSSILAFIQDFFSKREAIFFFFTVIQFFAMGMVLAASLALFFLNQHKKSTRK